LIAYSKILDILEQGTVSNGLLQFIKDIYANNFPKSRYIWDYHETSIKKHSFSQFLPNMVMTKIIKYIKGKTVRYWEEEKSI
jgi:hypothetical protein